MSEIRSAYEKAMERFKDVKPDKKALKRKEIIDAGKARCGKFLESGNIDIQAELNRYSDEEADWFKYGMGETILSRIALPSYGGTSDFVDILVKATVILSPQPVVAEQLLKQFKQLCQQYLNERLKLSEQLESQVQQILNQQGATLQNEQQKIALEQKLLKNMQEQMKKLQEQFQPAVEKVKANMRQLLGTWIEK